MEVYLSRFERPPPNGLVTRQLESEKSYDEAAWSDDHWQQILEKRKEIADIIDSTNSHEEPSFPHKPPGNIFPATDIRERKNYKLSKKPSALSNLGEKNLQTHEPPRLIQPRRHKDLQSSSQPPLSNAGVAAPIAPVDISPPALGIKPLTSTVKICQNIIDQLLIKIVEGSHMKVNTNEVSRQNTSNSTQNEFISVTKGVTQLKTRKIITYFEDYNKFSELHIEPTFDESEDNEDPRVENPCFSKSNQKRKKLQKKVGIVSKQNNISESKKMKRSKESCTKQDRLTPTVERKRCLKCFKAHFPLPKFCRWTKYSSVTKQTPLTKEDLKSKIKFDEPLKLDEYIKFLELKLEREWLYQRLSFGDKFFLLFYLLLNGNVFANKTEVFIQESETEDRKKSETHKCGNKDSYSSICETFFKNSTESNKLGKSI